MCIVGGRFFKGVGIVFFFVEGFDVGFILLLDFGVIGYIIVVLLRLVIEYFIYYN